MRDTRPARGCSYSLHWEDFSWFSLLLHGDPVRSLLTYGSQRAPLVARQIRKIQYAPSGLQSVEVCISVVFHRAWLAPVMCPRASSVSGASALATSSIERWWATAISSLSMGSGYDPFKAPRWGRFAMATLAGRVPPLEISSSRITTSRPSTSPRGGARRWISAISAAISARD